MDRQLLKCETISADSYFEFLQSYFIDTDMLNTFHKAVVLVLIFTILSFST